MASERPQAAKTGPQTDETAARAGGSERRIVPACGRFAPSPTGPLHLGSLRTALAAWLMARSAGGRFLLRIEDLDPDRSRPAWESVQLDALTRLGIDWDGPVVRQSERLDLYAATLARLTATGRVYPCFCTRAEIRAAASAPHADLPAGAYPGTCRALSAASAARRIAAGERHALRLDARGERVSFVDRLAGPVSGAIDDFVLRRADDVYAYQLAVVVDDAAQGVNQVVRGADLLDSVGRQILLMRLLGLSEPEWVHVPLVMGPDGRRLAKRHGGDGLADGELGGDGGAAEATLSRLGRSLGIDVDADAPPHRAADLLAGFSLERIPPEPVSVAEV